MGRYFKDGSELQAAVIKLFDRKALGYSEVC